MSIQETEMIQPKEIEMLTAPGKPAHSIGSRAESMSNVTAPTKEQVEAAYREWRDAALSKVSNRTHELVVRYNDLARLYREQNA